MRDRFSYLYTFFALFLVINFLIRLVLFGVSFDSLDHSIFKLLMTFFVGFVYDVIASFYYFIPLVIYLLLVPSKIYNSKFHKIFLYFISILMIFFMIFNGVSEYFFWEEFGKRFNFIAVDYLVYTHEVIKNIQESYPLPIILSSIFVISLLVVYLFRDRLFAGLDQTTFMQRLKRLALFLVMPFLLFFFVDKQGLSKVSDNIYNNELAKNGIYSLFSAFRHNELPYKEFYKSLDDEVVFKNLYNLERFNKKQPKKIASKDGLGKKNVILVMVESLSASYMGIYGNKKGLTPHLDKLTKKSLFFDNFYATGTRTVRGMEAVTLSIPPTAGRSIVKRPINDTLDSAGKIFKKLGYENKFIYAGHGYFDNMNDFFSKNGFKIVDRFDFDDDEITFANVWGVCDEDLFDKTIKEADRSYQEKKPFFSFVMTTSNHRPYTYPDGKIDIPSHSGRDGGVKYTDYAIDKFLKKAEDKPWFDDTIFVIVADHNGGSAGKTSLPIYRYKIPLFVYAPKLIKPQTVSKLSSQIDTIPTILSLLGFGYEAKFYGNNILDDSFNQRAFIGTYQKLGYVKDGFVYYLSPDLKSHKMKIEEQKLDSVKYKEEPISKKEEDELITYYQSASDIYENSIKEKE